MKLNFLIGSSWHTSLPAELKLWHEGDNLDEVNVLIDFTEKKEDWADTIVPELEIGDRVRSIKKGAVIHGSFGYVIKVNPTNTVLPIVVLWPTHKIVGPHHPSEIEVVP